MNHYKALQCPVCKAAFRSHTECPRCGADLSTLMFLCAKAHHLRSLARKAFYQHNYDEACTLTREAEDLQSTGVGRKMLLTAQALAMIKVDRV